jgi:hypothetical protein
VAPKRFWLRRSVVFADGLAVTRGPLLLVLVGCARAMTGEPAVDGSIGADGAGRADAAIIGSACQTALASKGTTFESGVAGWTHVVLDQASAPGWPLDEWQHGAATSGPGGCHGGSGCWATRLDANYTSCERAALISPPTDLSACAGQNVKLTFWNWFDFWSGTVSGKTGTWYDGGLVEVSTDGSTWMPVTPAPAYPGTVAINGNISVYSCVSQNSFYANGKPGFVGASSGWQLTTVQLPSAVLVPTFQYRFVFSSGVSYADNNAEGNRAYTRPGWYIDDVSFTSP